MKEYVLLSICDTFFTTLMTHSTQNDVKIVCIRQEVKDMNMHETTETVSFNSEEIRRENIREIMKHVEQALN